MTRDKHERSVWTKMSSCGVSSSVGGLGKVILHSSTFSFQPSQGIVILVIFLDPLSTFLHECTRRKSVALFTKTKHAHSLKQGYPNIHPLLFVTRTQNVVLKGVQYCRTRPLLAVIFRMPHTFDLQVSE